MVSHDPGLTEKSWLPCCYELSDQRWRITEDIDVLGFEQRLYHGFLPILITLPVP